MKNKIGGLISHKKLGKGKFRHVFIGSPQGGNIHAPSKLQELTGLALEKYKEYLSE